MLFIGTRFSKNDVVESYCEKLVLKTLQLELSVVNIRCIMKWCTEKCHIYDHIKGNILRFSRQKCYFKVILVSYYKYNLTFVILYNHIYYTHGESADVL